MTRVKICGITDIEQAIAASEAGANYLGLVFASSRRQLLPEKACEIVRAVRQRQPYPAAVGVFVNSSAEEVNRTAETCRLDWVQLSGDEDWDYCQNIRRPIIKAIHISANNTAEDVIRFIDEGHRLIPEERLVFLLDTQVKGTWGGTGQAFDWRLAREVAARFPVIIAGGLDPVNVGQLIKEVRPWGVDVSSGVETGGRKDIQKIKYFISNVKSYGESNAGDNEK